MHLLLLGEDVIRTCQFITLMLQGIIYNLGEAKGLKYLDMKNAKVNVSRSTVSDTLEYLNIAGVKAFSIDDFSRFPQLKQAVCKRRQIGGFSIRVCAVVHD